MDAKRAWQATLGQLQMELPKATYDTWVKNAELVSHKSNAFIIGVKNAYARDWLENRLTTTAERMLSGIMDAPQSISFIIRTIEEAAPDEQISAQAPSPPSHSSQPPTGINFNPRYTFDNFVVGPNNRLAHAASQAVAENPALPTTLCSSMAVLD